jgi:hypothetical protein
MANLDIDAAELGRFDLGLRKLSLKPSEYMQRQVRTTPVDFEDAGWALRKLGKDMLIFNTDYPHPEGGKDPFGDFERSLDAVQATPEELDNFYSKNFEDLLGLQLPLGSQQKTAVPDSSTPPHTKQFVGVFVISSLRERRILPMQVLPVYGSISD